jgi:PKD repeat protein
VVLTVTDDVGNVGVKSLTVDVTAAGPTALFTYSPTNPFVNQAVQFNGSGSSASFGRTLVSYDWDFGDGTAHGSGVTSSHTYTAAKTYTVVLQVTDDLGHTGVMSATITVGFPGPTASFTVSPIDPAVGQPVQFNATASVASPGLTITSYEWDFGDGSAHTTSASATTSHAFTTANTFTVVLTVTDSVGNKSTTSKTVTVR